MRRELRWLKMRSTALQAGLQAMFHFGPFALENTEVDGVAYASCGGDQVLTQRAFFFCANAQNGIARLLIERVSLQFDANAVADLEGVLKHQEFRFGVAGS